MVISANGGLVEDFNVVTLTGFEGEPGRPLVGVKAPLAGGGGGGNVSAPHAVDRLVVVGNPKLGGVVGGEPEIVIAGDGRSKITANPLAVIIAKIGNPFQAAKGVGDRSR